MDRRAFIATSSTLFLAHHGACRDTATFRVGVIGHTGRGNFGHGLDTVWNRVATTNIVAVADADKGGLEKAKKRLKVDTGFLDYRQMLETIRPQIVAICPRQPDQHRDMVIAAIQAGARGIYIEKPFCRTPAEADEISAACETHNVKLAVAHRNRYHPTLQAIDKLINDGVIGNVLEIRGRGKGDRRGGGEDLWVLGSHVLNLVNYFGGKPLSCSAVLLQDGRRVAKKDVRQGNEALGLLAGNELHARYRMERGFVAYFDSIANDGTRNAGFGLQIIGSEGIVDIKCDMFPIAHLVPGNPFEPTQESRPWIPITSAGPGKPEPIENLADRVGHHLAPASDLVDAIETDRQPLCNAAEGATTVEMVCACFTSHAQGSKAVELPLKHRGNALANLS